MRRAIAMQSYLSLSSQSGTIFSLVWKLLPVKVLALQKALAPARKISFPLDTFALRSYLGYSAEDLS
jgi:hypothetical protein